MHARPEHHRRYEETARGSPPTQGVAALEGLGLLERTTRDHEGKVRAVGLALEDAFAHVRDAADVRGLLEPAYLDGRISAAAAAATEPMAGTVYLCRRRPRPHGGLVHPEPVRRVRLTGGRARHGVVLQNRGDQDARWFKRGQVILVEGDVLVGGSDPRKDGYTAGF